jgi:hypothetical protein
MARGSGQLRQNPLLIGKDPIELLLIPKQPVQLGLIGFDTLLVGENLPLIGQDLFLVRDGRSIHRLPPRDLETVERKSSNVKQAAHRPGHTETPDLQAMGFDSAR